MTTARSAGCAMAAMRWEVLTGRGLVAAQMRAWPHELRELTGLLHAQHVAPALPSAPTPAHSLVQCSRVAMDSQPTDIWSAAVRGGGWLGVSLGAGALAGRARQLAGHRTRALEGPRLPPEARAAPPAAAAAWPARLPPPLGRSLVRSPACPCAAALPPPVNHRRTTRCRTMPGSTRSARCGGCRSSALGNADVASRPLPCIAAALHGRRLSPPPPPALSPCPGAERRRLQRPGLRALQLHHAGAGEGRERRRARQAAGASHRQATSDPAGRARCAPHPSCCCPALAPLCAA